MAQNNLDDSCMTHPPKVSVIVPIYNVQDYLRQCLDSVIGQTFSDYELILVDDGSTDGSGLICDEYDNKDKRVKVIHQENAGLPAARKVGIEHSQGEYVLYVDADDWVDDNHLDILVRKAEQEEADVVICGFYFEFPRKQVKSVNSPASLTGKGVIIESFKNSIHAGVVFKLIRRSLFTDYHISFPRYNYFEDMYLSTGLLLHTEKIASTGCSTYHYRYNPLSLTNIHNPSIRFEKYYEFIHNMEDLSEKYALLDDKELEDAFYDLVNRNKILLLELPFSSGRDIRRAYECFPHSWKWYKVGFSLVRMLYYFALRYHYLRGAQIYKHVRDIIKRILKGTR